MDIFPSLNIDPEQLEVVKNARISGLTSFGVHLSGFPFCTTYQMPLACFVCQKRVLAIIYPSVDIADSLCHSEILKLSDRRLEVCNKLFNDIVITPTNNRGNLPPARHTPRYNLRLPRVFVPPRAKTCRSVNTFVPSLVGVRNQS